MLQMPSLRADSKIDAKDDAKDGNNQMVKIRKPLTFKKGCKKTAIYGWTFEFRMDKYSNIAYPKFMKVNICIVYS
jgi:hypothetical protein